MSGAGNLFTVIDNRELSLNFNELSYLAIKLCNKNDINHYKTEGLLAVNSSEKSDFDVLFFNPDGSSDMMCGNGGRCAVFFAKELGFIANTNQETTFSMAGNFYRAEFDKNEIKLFLPPPLEISTDLELTVGNNKFYYDFIDVGSRHIVIDKSRNDVFNSLKKNSVKDLLEKIRRSPKFLPDGANVNLFETKNDRLDLITFEKGVEDITGACGTGAISTAFSAVYNKISDFPVVIEPPSKIPLTINITGTIEKPEKVTLKGHAEILGNDTFNLDLKEVKNA
jgi:diaminopimelate epimerase